MLVFLVWVEPRGCATWRALLLLQIVQCLSSFMVVACQVCCSFVVCVICVYACLAFVVEKPSLQALRAETMVERFTARMHVPAFRSRFFDLLEIGQADLAEVL